MYQTILTTHIILGASTLLVTISALVLANGANAKKYLYILTYGLCLQILSGVYMALFSETVTALGLCKNLTIYSIVVGIGCVSMYLRSEKIELKHYIYVGAPTIAVYSLFALAIINKV